MAPRTPIDPEIVRQASIFSTLDDSQVRQVCTLLKECRYGKGEIIYHQGDPGDCLYLIGRGRIRIFLTSPDGREITIRIYEPRAAFGEFAVLDGQPRSTGVAAIDDVIIYVLYREDFTNLLRTNFGLVQQVFESLIERLRYTTNYSEKLAFLSGPGRVAAVLVQLASIEANTVQPVRLDLTQQNLADFANTTREWVNRALRTFATEGLVRIERGAVYVLDQAGLQRRIN